MRLFPILAAILLHLSPSSAIADAADPEGSEPVWISVGYSSIQNEQGTPVGWLVTEFRIDETPPERINKQAGDSEPAEFSIDLVLAFRARRMGMDWAPPEDIEQGEALSESEAENHPKEWLLETTAREAEEGLEP